jgi:hypothetical protein
VSETLVEKYVDTETQVLKASNGVDYAPRVTGGSDATPSAPRSIPRAVWGVGGTTAERSAPELVAHVDREERQDRCTVLFAASPILG